MNGELVFNFDSELNSETLIKNMIPVNKILNSME